MLSEVPHGRVLVNGGFWARRQEANRSVSLALGHRKLEEAGNLENLREAACGEVAPPARGLPVFDSDIYKWLEAVGWELGRQPADPGPPSVADLADQVIKTLRSAQSPDGYVGSWFRDPRTRFSDLLSGLELYCAGHLFEAAVAWHRGLGDDRLLEVAVRFADHIGAIFGPGKRTGIPEHPGIELALVGLSRATGEQRYLDLGRFFLEQRGRALLTGGPFGPRYRQDEMPFRDARTARGHAVMNAYLACGGLDVWAESGDGGLFEAAVAQWEDMVSCRMYVTGGVGSRHKDEAFGDAFELPPDRSYCETCAAVGVVMWGWRLLLATGDVRYADVMERVLLNAFAVGVSLDGERFFYVNPLQVRAGRADPEDGRGVAARRGWYEIACCPPNVMRVLSSLERYFVSASAEGVQIWQFAPMRVAVTVAGGPVELAVRTGYPDAGRVVVRVDRAGGQDFEVGLRVPGWCGRPRGQVMDAAGRVVAGEGGDLAAGSLWRVRRRWRPGEELVLELPMAGRAVVADPRVDAVRGCVAVERGPLVYCLEQGDADGPGGVEAARLVAGAQFGVVPVMVAGEPVTALEGPGMYRRLPSRGGWPYRPAGAGEGGGQPGRIRLIPYHAWGNRHPGQAMRVWIPTT